MGTNQAGLNVGLLSTSSFSPSPSVSALFGSVPKPYSSRLVSPSESVSSRLPKNSKIKLNAMLAKDGTNLNALKVKLEEMGFENVSVSI